MAVKDLGTPVKMPIESVKPYENNPRDNDDAVGGGNEIPATVRLARTAGS